MSLSCCVTTNGAVTDLYLVVQAKRRPQAKHWDAVRRYATAVAEIDSVRLRLVYGLDDQRVTSL